MGSRHPLASAWSSIGTYLCLLTVGLAFAPAGTLVNEFLAFLSGGLADIQREPVPMLSMMSSILFMVAVQLPIAYAIGYGIRALLGKADSDVFGNLNDQGESNLFTSLFLVVWLEEIYARWLFLGVLTRVFTGPVGFYVLMLIGNGTWALIHLWNYKRQEQRNPLRVLSQFVSGLFFSFVFMKYGLLASVLAHFAFNAVIFAAHKVQNTDVIDGILIALHGLYAGVSFAIMDKPIADIGVWFDGSGTFAIPGWTFRDYLVVATLINSCFALLFDLLLYDKNNVGSRSEKTKSDTSLTTMAVLAVPVAALVMALYLAVVYAAYFIAGIFIDDVPATILVAAILLAFMAKSPSWSAGMRTFWTALPGSYIFICVANALGFMGSLGYLIVGIMISLPQVILHHFDD